MPPSYGPPNSSDCRWTAFYQGHTVDPKSKRYPAICKYCNLSYASARLEVLAKHIQSGDCKEIPADKRREYNVKLQQLVKSNKVRERDPADDGAADAVKPVAKKQPTQISLYGSFLDKKLTIQEQEKIDTALVDFVATGNLPFNIVNNPAFDKFIYAIHRGSSYALPSRDTLVSRAFDASIEIIANKKKALKQQGPWILGTDGWKDAAGRSVHGIMAIKREKQVILKLDDITTIRHSSAEMAKSIKDHAGDYFDLIDPKQVIAIVTDNPSVMVSMRTMIKDEFPNVIGVPCVLHVVNLMLKDTLGIAAITPVVDKIKTIANFFKAGFWQVQALEWGKSNNVTHGFVTHVETRWYSMAKVCKSVVSYQRFLQDVAGKFNVREKRVHRELIDYILDDMMFAVAKEVVEIVNPFVEAIAILEASDAHVGQVIIQMCHIRHALQQLSMRTDAGKAMKKHALKSLAARCDKFDTPVHWTAMFLTPSTKSIAVSKKPLKFFWNTCILPLLKDWAFDAETVEKALQECVLWFNNGSGDIVGIDPLVQWQANTTHPHLAKLAQLVLSIVPHSGSVERLFSQLGAIKTKARNSMDSANLETLAHVKEKNNFDNDKTMKRRRKKDIVDVQVQLEENDHDSVEETMDQPEDVITTSEGFTNSTDWFTVNFDWSIYTGVIRIKARRPEVAELPTDGLSSSLDWRTEAFMM
jgi:hypothetical protein